MVKLSHEQKARMILNIMDRQIQEANNPTQLGDLFKNLSRLTEVSMNKLLKIYISQFADIDKGFYSRHPEFLSDDGDITNGFE